MIFAYSLSTGQGSVVSQDFWRTGANFGLTLTGMNGSKDLSGLSFTIYARANGKVFFEKTVPEGTTKLSKTNIGRIWSEQVTWSDQSTANILVGLRITDGETLVEVNLGPATTRERTRFAPVEKDALIVTATEADLGIVQMPSYYSCIVDVRGMSEFDGVTSGGNRLNYLCYCSTDHNQVDGPDGVYLALCFGDPITGTWKRYDTALAAGDLDSFGGTKPSATGGKVFQYGSQCETPWIRKVGSTWVLTFHPRNVDGVFSPNKQRTMRATSSSPFGAFTVTDYGSTEAFLVNDVSDASVAHTGYATWDITPANATPSDDYFIRSLYTGGDTPTFAYWGADSNMDNPSAISTAVAQLDFSINMPTYEKNEGDPILMTMWGTTYTAWDGTDFVALTYAGIVASGAGGGAGGVYQVDLAADLITQTNPQPVLLPGDLWDLRGANDERVVLTEVAVPQIIERPGGGHVLFVYAQGDITLNEEYTIVMPITVSI